MKIRNLELLVVDLVVDRAGRISLFYQTMTTGKYYIPITFEEEDGVFELYIHSVFSQNPRQFKQFLQKVQMPHISPPGGLTLSYSFLSRCS